jgi:hypothetical protein
MAAEGCELIVCGWSANRKLGLSNCNPWMEGDVLALFPSAAHLGLLIDEWR